MSCAGRRASSSSFLHLSGVLELLPLLGGLAGADQVHVGTEVLLVFAGAVAGAVGTEAEVFGREELGARGASAEKVAALESKRPFLAAVVGLSPEFPPRGEVHGMGADE